jgi:glutamate formiminotransferase
MLRSLNRECKEIEKEIAGVVYYMNGGLNFVDAYELSMDQLNVLSETIKNHFEKQNEAFKRGRN